MRPSMLAFIVASYSCLIGITFGALSFTKTPTAPKALVNPLVLTCSIEPTNNNAPVSMAVGKGQCQHSYYIPSDNKPIAIIAPPPTSVYCVNCLDFTVYKRLNPCVDVNHHIIGTNTVIANLNQPDKTQINLDNAGYSVEGLLSNNGASYIKLTWKQPSRFESGTYYCAITALDASGKITPQRSTLTVSIQKPTFEDLLGYSRKQGELIEDHKTLILEHSKQLKDIEDRLKTTTAEIAETKSKVTGVTPRVEEGQVRCGNSQTFTFLPTSAVFCLPFREKKIPVVFTKPYATVPSITLSASQMDIDKTNGTRLYYLKQNVSEKGFDIICGTWCDTQIYELVISWQARN